MISELRCPRCAGPMESGYLYHRLSFPAWSSSPRPLSAFHGVSLVKAPLFEWLRASIQFRAPALPAARCSSCLVGVFEYSAYRVDDPVRSSRRASTFAFVYGGIWLLGAIALAILLYIQDAPLSRILFVIAVGGALGFVVVGIGIAYRLQVRKLAGKQHAA